MDGGIFGSHIGFENAISSDNSTLTRSLLAENSPYYLTGVKLGVSTSKNWLFSALILNGWQRIQRVHGNSMLSFGTQINYKPTDKFVFNWSTFIGTDDPDSTRRIRYFSNLYAQISPSKKVKMIFGFDLGLQQQNKHSDRYNYWLSPVFITQLQLAKKWYTAIRFEYYEDKQNIIITTANLKPFQTGGVSINIDYWPQKIITVRLEARLLQSSNNIYIKGANFSNQNIFVCSSIAINLSQSFRK